MKALVVRQPWAWAIMEGHKSVENRSWRTTYRGPLVIVAGGSRASLNRGTAFCESLGIFVPKDLPRSCILGVVTLIDIFETSVVNDSFAEGPWCWMLGNPVRLEYSVPYRKGRLGLFDLPSEVLKTENHEATTHNLAGILA